MNAARKAVKAAAQISGLRFIREGFRSDPNSTWERKAAELFAEGRAKAPDMPEDKIWAEVSDYLCLLAVEAEMAVNPPLVGPGSA